jgi:hypothetical protein
LTITLSEERYRALLEAAAKRRKSLVSIIDERLESCRIKNEMTAAALVAPARQHAGLSEEEALELATREAEAETSLSLDAGVPSGMTRQEDTGDRSRFRGVQQRG